MAFYRGRIGADLTPAFGKEEEWDPVNNNGSPYFLLDPAIGWDPYRLPSYVLQELVTDYGILDQTYVETVDVPSVQVDDTHTGTDILYGTTDSSYWDIPASPATYLYDDTNPVTFTVTSPYTLQNPTEKFTHAFSDDRTWSATSNSHTVTTFNLGNAPSGAVTNAAIGGNTRIINDFSLANSGSQVYQFTQTGSFTSFVITENNIFSYGSGHKKTEYGSSKFLNQDISAKCYQIVVTCTDGITNADIPLSVTYPSKRSVDDGYIWNSGEQAAHGGSNAIGVTTIYGTPIPVDSVLRLEFKLRTYKDRGANQDVTSAYNITYVAGTQTDQPKVVLSKKSNPGVGQGAPKGYKLDGDVAFPFVLFAIDNTINNHSPKAWTNVNGKSWVEDPDWYKSAQYPVKSISVLLKYANGNIFADNIDVTRPLQDGKFGYYNGVTSANAGPSDLVQVEIASGQIDIGMTVELTVEYDRYRDNNAGVDWTSYFDAFVSDINGAEPKLRVLGNGSSPLVPSGAGVPHGMAINVQFHRSNGEIPSGHGRTILVNDPNLHDPINFARSLGITTPTYGCYQMNVTVKDENGNNKNSLVDITLPPLDAAGYYLTEQGVLVEMKDGSGVPHNWTVRIAEKHQTYRDLGLNADITADYTWSVEYIDSSDPELGVFLKVRKNGTQVGPPSNTYMRVRYDWPLDPGGLPIIVLLNQNFYR